VDELRASGLSELFDYLAELIAEALARRRAGVPGATTGEERAPGVALEGAARYLDWPKQRLYKLSASGALPHYKQEGRLLFRRDELDAWLAQFAQGERDWLRGRSQS
jgi:excisionase family DNA binding protein